MSDNSRAESMPDRYAVYTRRFGDAATPGPSAFVYGEDAAKTLASRLSRQGREIVLQPGIAKLGGVVRWAEAVSATRLRWPAALKLVEGE